MSDHLPDLIGERAALRAENERLRDALTNAADDVDRLREALRGLASYLEDCEAIEDNDPDVCRELRIRAAEAREKA